MTPSLFRRQVLRKNGVVYCLIDPQTEHVRYVGVTNKLSRRLGHMREDYRKEGRMNPRLREWFVGLVSSGKFPRMEPLEYVIDRIAGEQYWIGEMWLRGCDLLNVTIGGLGHSGAPRTAKTKEDLRRANIGKTQSAEARQKMSASRTGIPKSESHKAAIGAAHKGKPKSPEHRANLSASLRASEATKRPKSPSHRANLAIHLRALAEKRRKDRENVPPKIKIKKRSGRLPGFHLSEQTKKKISESKIGKPRRTSA
jgi:hypothetical protein